MGPFDKYKLTEDKEEPEIIVECEHQFPDSEELITIYDDKYCTLVVEFAREGNFIEGFCGKFNICSNTLYNVWLNREDKTYAKFRSAVKTAQSALFCFYNEELVHAINNYETMGAKVSVLRSILSDLMKLTPKAIRDLQFEDVAEGETLEQRKEREEKERMCQEYAAFRPGVAILSE